MRRSASAIAAVLLLLALAGQATADPGSEAVIVADLEGIPIAAGEVSRYFCHDRAFPSIHCFATAGALEQELATAESAAVGTMVASAADYVQIYAGTDRTGASMVVSQDYDTLFVVGWNDRIRSYRGLNSARGFFWTDWYATGSSLAFCCNVVDLTLPATFDRAITSVYRQ
jgi:hypothetical protein